jgi:hypothetical protein
MQRLRPVILFVALIVIFAAGLWLGFKVPRWFSFGSGPRIYGTATVLQQVQTLSELVTVKYVMEKVIVLEDVKWYPGGENRLLLVAHGVAKAGVDFKQMKPDDLRISGKTVSIRMPPAQITDTYLDEKQTRVIERTTGLLRTFDKDLEQTARQNAVDDMRRSARVSGILKDAEERARDQAKILFLQMGYDRVEFRSE